MNFWLSHPYLDCLLHSAVCVEWGQLWQVTKFFLCWLCKARSLFFSSLCWFCKQGSSLMFVYVVFVKEAFCFCLFMLGFLNKALYFCWFCRRSSSFILVYVALVNEAVCFGLFMLKKATKKLPWFSFSLLIGNEPTRNCDCELGQNQQNWAWYDGL